MPSARLSTRSITTPSSTPASPTDNTRPANAPVSYPFIWDTPQQELEQWIGIAKSGGPLDAESLSRNVGEVLGVFADYVIPNDPTPLGYSSSVKISGLVELENQLKGLWSPQWPVDFPPINQVDAAKGKAIYQQLKCDTCHTLVTNRKDPGRTIVSYMKADQTDPGAYLNFFNRFGPSGKLEGADVNLIPFNAEDTGKCQCRDNGHQRGRRHDSRVEPGRLRLTTCRKSDLASPGLMECCWSTRLCCVEYKARPLDGIWATAPYLHNGSVPNLDELFQPAAQRSKSFSIGVRTFDPVRVGYLTDVAGFPKFNVIDSNGNPIAGNSNAGHEGEQYGTNLSPDERRQLIEYLEVALIRRRARPLLSTVMGPAAFKVGPGQHGIKVQWFEINLWRRIEDHGVVIVIGSQTRLVWPFLDWPILHRMRWYRRVFFEHAASCRESVCSGGGTIISIGFPQS